MDTKEQFDSLEDGNYEFSDIPENERLNVDRMLCGLLKAQLLMKSPEKFWLKVYAEHDIIYFQAPDEISEEDAIYLKRCGVFYNDENSLAFFK